MNWTLTFTVTDILAIWGALIGTARTTLQGIGLMYYESWWLKIRGSASKSMVVNEISNKPLPCIIESGDQWQGRILQDKSLGEMARSGYLYCEIDDAVNKKTTVKRIIIKTTGKETGTPDKRV